jgi:general secretion pathway protein A
MYQSFFNFTSAPFENTPDPRCFFASEQHREALASIEYVIRLRKGFALITGPVGAGKTTVGRTMCERCNDQATIVHMLHGHEDGRELTHQLLRALSLPVRRNEEHSRTLERLRDSLMDRLYRGRPVVILVDEGQNLSDAALEELRLLSNFDTATQKPVQVVLIGQSELRTRLRLPKFDSLRQRIVLAKEIRALGPSETAAYITHRLRWASADRENPQVAFAPEVIHEIHEHSGGLPRMINVIADNCLLLGYVKESRQISSAMVRRVLSDLLPNFAEPSERVSDRPGVSDVVVTAKQDAAESMEVL